MKKGGKRQSPCPRNRRTNGYREGPAYALDEGKIEKRALTCPKLRKILIPPLLIKNFLSGAAKEKAGRQIRPSHKRLSSLPESRALGGKVEKDSAKSDGKKYNTVPGERKRARHPGRGKRLSGNSLRQ